MDPALALIAACCRWPDDEARHEAVREAAAAPGLDWRHVERLAERHRVEGLVDQGLSAAQVDVPPAIRDAAPARREEMLLHLTETIRISRTLAQGSIAHHILKGLPLGVRVYADPRIKRSWDIDLLVDPDDAVAAAALLRGLGYNPAIPPRPLERAEFARWSLVSKEAELRSVRGLTVELHWRLADHPMLLPVRPRDLPSLPVALIGDQAVPTLPDAINLAYLAVHGAGHGWARLKWLADFAALAASYPTSERRALFEQARNYGCGRALGQAALLAQRFLALESVFATSDPAIRRLADLAEATISAHSRSIPDETAASRAIGSARRRLMPGPRYTLQDMRIIARGTLDRIWLPLPRGLRWAYWLIRPATAVVRTAHRAWARRQTTNMLV